MRFSCSSYHKKTYRPRSLKAQVNRVIRNLEKLQKNVKFDAIAFRGISGAAVAYPVSVLAGYHLIFVRKEKHNQHHGREVEGSENRKIRRYIILDDFINCGDTVKAIIHAIDKDRKGYLNPPKCVGVAIYNKGETSKKKEVYVEGNRIPVFIV